MENYWTGNPNDTTTAISETLMKSVIKSLDALQKNPDDYQSRANLA
jgi:alcohol dehydrogenase YqhD (iron-dependent ADH family)